VRHVAPSVVAFLGAGVLVLVSGLQPGLLMPSAEWETVLFFAGLFVVIGALVMTGVIDILVGAATDATGGNALLAVMLILALPALLSGIMRQHPLPGDHEPTRARLVPQHPQPRARGGPVVGANVVSLGIAARAGTPISFWEFTRRVRSSP
jgi:Na+/H+ antiporter NhaD/arsenite permease-like protein